MDLSSELSQSGWGKVRKGSLEPQGAGILSSFLLVHSCLFFFTDKISHCFVFKSHNLLQRKSFVGARKVFRVVTITSYLFFLLNKPCSMSQEHFQFAIVAQFFTL